MVNREVLFRGRRLDTGEWVYGTLAYAASDKFMYGAYIMPEIYAVQAVDGALLIGGYIEVDPATVGQYVEQKDKNGNRVFEGDVVVFSKKRFVIKYVKKYARFAGTRPGCVFAGFMLWSCEVIGNIHDTPGLQDDVRQGGEGHDG